MKYYLVSYAHQNGFGRRLFGRSGPVDEDAVFHWEKSCEESLNSDGKPVGKCVILAISEIDGPITPVREQDADAD